MITTVDFHAVYHGLYAKVGKTSGDYGVVRLTATASDLFPNITIHLSTPAEAEALTNAVNAVRAAHHKPRRNARLITGE